MENHFQKISRDNKMKISVIIPVYNEEESINHCLNALINQNFPKKNYEIIIINDGSTDKTKENIEKIIINNSKANIKLINQKNKGRALTREIGAKKAKYENLLFTDARCKAEKNLLKNTSLTNEQCIVGNPLINQENWFGRFGYLLRKKLYKKSFYNFNQIYLTKSNFDHISKGTTILFIKKSINISPFNTPALLQLSQAYRFLDQKKYSKMERKVLEFILDFDPKNVNALSFLAKNLAVNGRGEDAAIVYTRLKKSFEYFKDRSNFGPYHHNVGFIAISVGDYKYAEYIYKDAIEKFPTAENFYKMAILKYDYFKNYKEGVIFAKKALEIDPNFTNNKEIKELIKKYESSTE